MFIDLYQRICIAGKTFPTKHVFLISQYSNPHVFNLHLGHSVFWTLCESLCSQPGCSTGASWHGDFSLGSCVCTAMGQTPVLALTAARNICDSGRERVLGDNKICVNQLQAPLPAALAQQTGIFVGNEHKSSRITGPEQCTQCSSCSFGSCPSQCWDGRELGPCGGMSYTPPPLCSWRLLNPPLALSVLERGAAKPCGRE